MTKKPDNDQTRAKVRKVLDIIGGCRDAIANWAAWFGMILFVIAGLFSGYMLLYATQGILGTRGAVLGVGVAVGLLALFAYLDKIEEEEDARIEREVDEEYRALKEEEQRLISELKAEAEKKEMEFQLQKGRLFKAALEEMKKDGLEEISQEELEELARSGLAESAHQELVMPSMEELESVLSEATDTEESQADHTASIKRLRTLQDQLKKFLVVPTKEARDDIGMGEEPAGESEKHDKEIVQEELLGMHDKCGDEQVVAEALRRATLRRRVVGSDAALSEARSSNLQE
jgi:hypothetical protein